VAFLSLFLRLPWPAYLLLATGLAWLGMDAARETEARNEQIALALRNAPPVAVEVEDLPPLAPGDRVGEVNVRAQIDPDLNTHFTFRGSHGADGESYVYILVATDAQNGVRAALAAIELSATEKALFVQNMSSADIARGAVGPVVPIAGLRSGSDGHAQDVLKKNGWVAAPGFTMIEPFLGMRETELRRRIADPAETRNTILCFAGFMVAMAIGRFLLMRNRAAAPARPGGKGKRSPVPSLPLKMTVQRDGNAAMTGPVAHSPVQDFGIIGDTPIDRLRRRAAAEAAVRQATSPQAYVGPVTAEPTAIARLGSLFEKPAMKWIGGALLLVALQQFSRMQGAPIVSQMNVASPADLQAWHSFNLVYLAYLAVAGLALFGILRAIRNRNDSALGHALVDKARLDAAMKAVPFYKKTPLIAKLMLAGAMWYGFSQAQAFADAHDVRLTGSALVLTTLGGPLLVVLAVVTHTWLRLTGQFATRNKMRDRLALDIATQELLSAAHQKSQESGNSGVAPRRVAPMGT